MPYNGVMADLGNPLYCRFQGQGGLSPVQTTVGYGLPKHIRFCHIFCKGPVIVGAEQALAFPAFIHRTPT